MKKFLLTCIGLLGVTAVSAQNYVKTAFDELETDDKVVIVATSKPVAMGTTLTTKNGPVQVEVTLNTEKTEILSDVTSAITFTVVKVEGGVKFAVSENNFLYCKNDNDGVRFGSETTSTNNVFSWKVESEVGYLYNNGVSRYIGLNGTNDWRCYTSVNTNVKGLDIAIYKLETSSDPAITVVPTFDLGKSKTVPEAKTLTVKGNNLSAAIAYAWEKGASSPFTASGTLTAAGGSLEISLDQTSVGEYSDVLVLTSGNIEERVEVTAEILDASNTDNITASMLPGTAGKYVGFDGITVSSGAVYAGNTALNGDNNIQMNNNSSNGYGIVVISSNKYIKKVAVDWASNTSNGRVLNVYVSNTPYESAADLYNNKKQGTLIGTIVKGTSTELDITGEYKYVGIVPAFNAQYFASVEFVWAVPATASVEIEADDYASFSYNAAVEIPEGLEAYYVSAVTSKEATLTAIEDVIPANQGVILKNMSGDAQTFALVPPTSGVAAINGNLLVATDGSTVAEGNYILAQPAGKEIGFYPLDADYALAAGHAYLPASAVPSTPSGIKIKFGESGVADIVVEGEGDDQMYNMLGQKVNANYKGIVIKNGKKYINK